METSGDAAEAVKEKTTVASDPRNMATKEGTTDKNGVEPEAKRLKSLSTRDHCGALEEKPSLQAKATSTDSVHEVKSPLASPALPEKRWQCGFCTFLNDPGLPYCEMCENPQGRAGECTGGAGEVGREGSKRPPNLWGTIVRKVPCDSAGPEALKWSMNFTR